MNHEKIESAFPHAGLLENDAATFKALGDEKRLRIMRQIAERPGICSCKVLEEHDMSQSTLSHHMKLLCEAGLVKCEKDGKWVHYTLNPKGLEKTAETLFELAKEAKQHSGNAPTDRQAPPNDSAPSDA